MTSALADFSTGTLCNASPEVMPVDSRIRPLIPGRRISGPARTARIVPGQNAAVHRAVAAAAPGDVLVVDGAGSERFGPFGDLLADACRQRGLAGAVFDCTIRDSGDIADMGFQVFARGFHPESTGKVDPGEIDVAVTIGGVLVHPADIVVGDDDGVVVVPQRIAGEVFARAEQVERREAEIRRRIRSGETTVEIFDLDRP